MLDQVLQFFNLISFIFCKCVTVVYILDCFSCGGGELVEGSEDNVESSSKQTLAWFTETQVLSALSARSREGESAPADSNDFSIGKTAKYCNISGIRASPIFFYQQ